MKEEERTSSINNMLSRESIRGHKKKNVKKLTYSVVNRTKQN